MTLDRGFYTVGEAASITDVPRSTLHYWLRTQLLEPVVTSRPTLFAFTDLRDIKVIDRLRKAGARTQNIRRAIDWLREQDNTARIAAANFYVIGREVFHDYGETRISATRRGQVSARFTVGDVMSELGATVTDIGGIVLHPIPEVTIDPRVRGGTPVVRGTRVPTALVLEMHEEGLAPDQIRSAYPTVSPEAILPVVKWERSRRSAAA